MLADLAHPPIPPEKNAATYLRRAEAGIDAILQRLEPIPSREYNETRDSAPDYLREALAAEFSKHPDVIPLLQQAADCPDYDPQFDYTVANVGVFITNVLPVVQVNRKYSYIIAFRVRQFVVEGKYDEALRTALILFRLSRHFGATQPSRNG